MASLDSELTKPPLLAGVQLKGQAFYALEGKPFCEPCYLVSTARAGSQTRRQMYVKLHLHQSEILF